jgi:hypothetical protein
VCRVQAIGLVNTKHVEDDSRSLKKKPAEAGKMRVNSSTPESVSTNIFAPELTLDFVVFHAFEALLCKPAPDTFISEQLLNESALVDVVTHAQHAFNE